MLRMKSEDFMEHPKVSLFLQVLVIWPKLLAFSICILSSSLKGILPVEMGTKYENRLTVFFEY